MGAWIEMRAGHRYIPVPLSRPAWARGLKFRENKINKYMRQVAPCVGAWIEIRTLATPPSTSRVAPCVGAWIEIIYFSLTFSLADVAPCVGAWIEIQIYECDKTHARVAPCVGAWIEMKGEKK